MDDHWVQASENEWRRRVGDVRVVRSDAGWRVLAGSMKEPVLKADGTEFTAPDSETARRLCDYGQFSRDGVPPVYEFPDEAGLPALVEAILRLHGLEATWLESVPVHEKHKGETVWEGEVQVFAVEHPKASRVYAWSHESDDGKRRFHAVLGAEPVDGAAMAVRVAIVEDVRKAGS